MTRPVASTGVATNGADAQRFGRAAQLIRCEHVIRAQRGILRVPIEGWPSRGRRLLLRSDKRTRPRCSSRLARAPVAGFGRPRARRRHRGSTRGREKFLASLPGVVRVHDLHIGGLGTTHVALTAHAVKLDPGLEDDLLTHAGRELADCAALSAGDVLHHLGTDAAGLSRAEAANRLAASPARSGASRRARSSARPPHATYSKNDETDLVLVG